MSILEAIILGIIQGLSEFIPISSTAHLTIAGQLMGLIDSENPEHWTSFIATVQLGTLAAVFVYFYKDIKNISTNFLKENLFKPKKISEQNPDSKLGWLIILGSIPIVIVAFLFKDFIEGAFTKQLSVIGVSLIALALILALAERSAKLKKDLKDLSIWDSIIVGLSQCMALIPGSSRSGTTITAGLFLGMKRDVAARFSFLLGIPAILGSGVLSFIQSLEYIQPDQLLSLIVSTVFSGISGYLSIAFLLNFLKKNSTALFIWYRIILGSVLLGLIYFGVLN